MDQSTAIIIIMGSPKSKYRYAYFILTEVKVCSQSLMANFDFCVLKIHVYRIYGMHLSLFFTVDLSL